MPRRKRPAIAKPAAALLGRLVCPVSHQPLRWDDSQGELISHAAGLAFPVRDGVPIMVVDEARRLSDEELQ